MSGLFPDVRPRRLRRAPWLRALVAEHHLRPEHLIWPLFVTDAAEAQPIAPLPGQFRWPVKQLVAQARAAQAAGIAAIALFPCVVAAHKTDDAAEALRPGNL